MAAMTQMSIDINKAYDKDMDGSLVREMPVMQGIKTYKDIAGLLKSPVQECWTHGWPTSGTSMTFPL